MSNKSLKEQSRNFSRLSCLSETPTEKNSSKHIFHHKSKKRSPKKPSEAEETEPRKLPILTIEMIKVMKTAWFLKSSDEILVSKYGINIKQEDLRTLLRSKWLNNEIINFYMNLINDRAKRKSYPSVYAINSFFYVKLQNDGHKGVKLWTKKVDIFAHKLFIVPVHNDDHWSLAIVDFKNKAIRYYDSLGLTNKKLLCLLQKYIEDESLDKKNIHLDTTDWDIISVKNIPQQNNTSDCGVFCCAFAECISANRKITFAQKDMSYFRKKIAYEILKAKLL